MYKMGVCLQGFALTTGKPNCIGKKEKFDSFSFGWGEGGIQKASIAFIILLASKFEAK